MTNRRRRPWSPTNRMAWDLRNKRPVREAPMRPNLGPLSRARLRGKEGETRFDAFGVVRATREPCERKRHLRGNGRSSSAALDREPRRSARRSTLRYIRPCRRLCSATQCVGSATEGGWTRGRSGWVGDRRRWVGDRRRLDARVLRDELSDMALSYAHTFCGKSH
jgi:hypothetical protein